MRCAISPGFFGHYQDLGISCLKSHNSACNLILSVGLSTRLRWALTVKSLNTGLQAIKGWEASKTYFGFKTEGPRGKDLHFQFETKEVRAWPTCRLIRSFENAHLVASIRPVVLHECSRTATRRSEHDTHTNYPSMTNTNMSIRTWNRTNIHGPGCRAAVAADLREDPGRDWQGDDA